jgi:hypothetical protein
MLSTVTKNVKLSEEEVKAEIAKQVGWDVVFDKVHITQIQPGDTVFHEGLVRTVCRRKITKDSFMGSMLFGDSYQLGSKPVYRVAFQQR